MPVTIQKAAPGLLLIVAGAALLLALRGSEGSRIPAGAVVTAVGGAACLVAYAFTLSYGLLTAGAMLEGLGTGLIVQARSGGHVSWPVLVGLGAGLVLIYVTDRLATGRSWTGNWWPLLIGLILCLFGLGNYLGGTHVWRETEAWWPILLVAIGLWCIWRSLRTAPSQS